MESPMKKSRKILWLIPLFLIGLSILLYPTVSDMWNEYRAKQLITKYGDTVTTQSTDTSALLEAAKAYNESLAGEVIPDAFSIRENVKDANYESLLNVNGDGMMGYVEIPAISVEIPIYHYTTQEVLEKGAGHLFGSSLPVGGDGPHAVISAHRGLPSAKLFSDLDLVKKGDVFYIHVLDQILAYEVDQIETVLPEETSSLAAVKGEDYVTLITCTPYGVNTHRLLVRGHRIPYTEETYQATVTQKAAPKTTSVLLRVLSVVAGVVIAIVIVTIMNVVSRHRRKKVENTADDAGKEKEEENSETKDT